LRYFGGAADRRERGLVTGLPLADVAWWAPLAIIGGALGGALVGYLLLVAVGSSRRRPADTGRTGWERTDKTNYTVWNPAAFLAVGAAVALVVGLAVGLSVD
jgi:hypothetical protein